MRLNDKQQLAFDVPGTPVPKGRPRVGRYGAYTPKRTKAYESKVKMYALKARQEQGWKRTSGPVSMSIRIRGGRGDIDNVGKAIGDALNGIAYDDDKQIRTMVLARDTGDPGVSIIVWLAGEGPDYDQG